MNRSKFLFPSMCFLIFLNYTTFALPMSFYPGLADSLGLSTFLIGLSFSVSSFGAFLCSFMIGKFMRFMGKGYLVLFFQIISSLSTFLFGFLTFFMDSPFSFYIISVVLRFISGFSVGGFYTVVYSLVPEYWHDEVSRRIGKINHYFENFLGVVLFKYFRQTKKIDVFFPYFFYSIYLKIKAIHKIIKFYGL